MTDLAIDNGYGDWNRAIIANRAQFFKPGRKVAHPLPERVARPEIEVLPPVESTLAETFAHPLVENVAKRGERPVFYAAVTVILTLIGIMSVWISNQSFAPEMYGDGMVPAATAFAKGQNYAVFDLNLNIRRLREEHVALMTETPDVVVYGASQWQEAHADLLPGKRVYNSHIHRDYWEDVLGVVEIWARNGRLPKQMIITIRDALFTPVANRGDFLWEPGIPNYRLMADRLGIEKGNFFQTLPYHRMRERLSLSMLFENVTRWYNAGEKPQASTERHFASLDTLLPDGSILWSAGHRKLFTQERSRREALNLAASRRNNPPMIDPKGVEAINALLAFLKQQGVEVMLAHPPFNPIFYDSVRDTPYITGLRQVEHLTRELAEVHGLNIVGSFDPYRVGCTKEMFIDADHSSPECIGKLLAEFNALQVPTQIRGSGELN